MTESEKNNPAAQKSIFGTSAGRMGNAEEMGRLVNFLAGDGIEFMMGNTVLMDGGFIADRYDQIE